MKAEQKEFFDIMTSIKKLHMGVVLKDVTVMEFGTLQFLTSRDFDTQIKSEYK